MPAEKPEKKTAAVAAPPPGMTYDKEHGALVAARGAGERAHHQMGLHFGNVVRYQLYKEKGFASAVVYVEKALQGEPSEGSLNMWATVASRFTEDQAAEHTCHKLSHLLTYAAATGIEDLSNPGEVAIEVLQQDGRSLTKKLSECSAMELEQTLRVKGPKAAMPAGLEAAAKRFNEALTGFLGPESQVRVNVVRRGRSAVAQIDNLQESELQRLQEMLRQS
ncbi:MAG TPA: hypothetical protein VGK67_05335 [Myxococcales bacterium]|jgi:hypothetical protein